MHSPVPFRSPLALAGAAVVGLALVVGACSDRGDPVGTPAPVAQAPNPVLVTSLRCVADVKSRAVSCDHADLPSGVRGYIVLGGQHTYVNLVSSNVAYAGTDFQFDVTVQNLIPQAMGTTDGTTADPTGVRVLFASGPSVTGGTGNTSVANADGMGTFTATNQPYFQYAGAALGADGILSTNETSSAKTWHLNVDATVTTFTFTLYVATEVHYPNGYVDISGVAHQLAGGSQAAGAVVRLATGALAGDQTVTWGTTNAAVATVDGSGNVTAVAPGTASITATQGARSGALTVNVCPNLAVGGVYVSSSTAAASSCFGGGAGAEEFTYMPLNFSTSSSLPATVTGTGIQAVTGPPTPDRIPLGPSLLKIPAPELQAATDLPFLERDLPRMNALMANRASRVRRASRGRSGSGARFNITPNHVSVVGDSMDLNTNSSCSGSPNVRRGVVRSVSQHLVIVGDTANPAGGFTTAQYDSIALEFDTIAWPVDSANFGAPTDEDGTGHVVAFFTRAVNELSPPASSSVVLGFFASKDVFSADPVDGCSNSNEGEIFYMLVPDPTGVVNSNVRTVSFVRGNTTGTLGHEFQHMINAFRRAYVTGASFFEQGFLNEGLSHIAEELMFYRASGMTPRSNVGPGTNAVSGVQLNSRRVTAYNAYESQNIGRFRPWLQRPDTTGALKNNANSLAVRGAIWAFLRYSADRVNGNDQTFWFNLVNSNLEGTANIQNAIGGASPTSWERDFTAALYADDNAFSVASQYTNPSWNFRALYSLLFGSYSLLARPLSNGVGLSLTYSSGGGTAYTRFGVPAAGFADLSATSGSGLGTNYGLIVVRTK